MANNLIRQLVCFGILLMSFKCISSLLLPNILWNRHNPIFNNTTCPGGNVIKVKLNDKLNIVCPNKANNIIPLDDAPTPEELHTNLYISSDKKAYDDCDATNARKLLSCDSPNVLGFYTFMFRKRAPSQLTVVFEEGTTYYIFATGDGTSSGQSNKMGGMCKTHNVKMQIYVCNDDEDCSESLKECQGIPAGSGQVLSYRGEDQTFSEKITDASVLSCLIAFLLIGAFIGIVIGYALNRVWKTRDRDPDRRRWWSRNGSRGPNSTCTTYCDQDSNENTSSKANIV